MRKIIKIIFGNCSTGLVVSFISVFVLIAENINANEITLYHRASYSGMFHSGTDDYEASIFFGAGNNTHSVPFATERGYVEFLVPDLGPGAIIDNAILHIKCTFATGTNYPFDGGTILLRNLSEQQSYFYTVDDWNHLNGTSTFTTVNIALAEAKDIDVKSKISSGTLVYFGIINNDETTNGLSFSQAQSDLYLTITYTVPCSDKTPPSVPTGLTASNVTRTSLDLSWTASTDNVGVTGYKVYLNGAYSKTVTTTSTSFSNLTPNTEYTFNVSAYDACNNVSGQSNTLHVITTPYTLTLSSDLTSSITYNAFAFTNVRLLTGFKFAALNSQYDFHTMIVSGQQQWTTSNLKSAILDENGITENLPNEKVQNDPGSILGNTVLYPNPTNDKLFVEGLSEFEVKVFDLSGRNVLNITKASGSIDVSSLNKGIYMIHLKSGGKTYIQKVVKQE